MWSVIAIVVGILLLAVLAVGVTFALGMRAKTPWVLDRVRHFARAIGNPYQMRTAGTPGAMASVIEHRGRTSGRAHRTPVDAVPTEDGFVIATVYGARTDWLKNVLASGSATIVNEGRARSTGPRSSRWRTPRRTSRPSRGAPTSDTASASVSASGR
jgi:deazaflavin-dependent oxidoreductase (nitroreductase family)